MTRETAMLSTFKDLYVKLEVSEPRYGRKRSKFSKRVRRDLGRMVGAHDWASADPWQREIIEEARRLRKLYRHHPPTMASVTGWYFYQKMREQSIARRVLGVTQVTS